MLPDATHIVAIRLGVVVRVAIIEVRVVGICGTVLRPRPEVVGRILFVTDFNKLGISSRTIAG